MSERTIRRIGSVGALFGMAGGLLFFDLSATKAYDWLPVASLVHGIGLGMMAAFWWMDLSR